jgi:hypothetical protein
MLQLNYHAWSRKRRKRRSALPPSLLPRIEEISWFVPTLARQSPSGAELTFASVSERHSTEVLTSENVGRRSNNTPFVGLIANSWVGTSVAQSDIVEIMFRNLLATGKTVTMAVKHSDGPAEGNPWATSA